MFFKKILNKSINFKKFIFLIIYYFIGVYLSLNLEFHDEHHNFILDDLIFFLTKIFKLVN